MKKDYQSLRGSCDRFRGRGDYVLSKFIWRGWEVEKVFLLNSEYVAVRSPESASGILPKLIRLSPHPDPNELYNLIVAMNDLIVAEVDGE